MEEENIVGYFNSNIENFSTKKRDYRYSGNSEFINKVKEIIKNLKNNDNTLTYEDLDYILKNKISFLNFDVGYTLNSYLELDKKINIVSFFHKYKTKIDSLDKIVNKHKKLSNEDFKFLMFNYNSLKKIILPKELNNYLDIKNKNNVVHFYTRYIYKDQFTMLEYLNDINRIEKINDAIKNGSLSKNQKYFIDSNIDILKKLDLPKELDKYINENNIQQVHEKFINDNSNNTDYNSVIIIMIMIFIFMCYIKK